MIQERTALVLGAGASIDFGYPSGWNLVLQVQQALRTAPVANHLGAAGFDSLDRAAFADALRDSAAMSVDAFLEHRAGLVPLGKHAMAAVLVMKETPQTLFSQSAPTWLHLLVDRLGASLDEWRGNQLSIITFNYDRVIEQFLSQAVANRLGLKLDKAAELVQSTIPIVHVHGSLGALPHFDGENARAYNPNVSSGIIRKAAEGIKIIHEGVPTSPEFQKAKELLVASSSVVFMGFGYNPTNLHRLGIPSLPSHIRVWGTSVGMTPMQREVASERSGRRISIDVNGDLPVDYMLNNRILGV